MAYTYYKIGTNLYRATVTNNSLWLSIYSEGTWEPRSVHLRSGRFVLDILEQITEAEAVEYILTMED